MPTKNSVGSSLGEPTFKEGDVVEKSEGYKWPGVIVSAFRTLNGEWRFVVECTAPGVLGALHIYSAKHLRHVPF
jgi:hypothetical protein